MHGLGPAPLFAGADDAESCDFESLEVHTLALPPPPPYFLSLGALCGLRYAYIIEIKYQDFGKLNI